MRVGDYKTGKFGYIDKTGKVVINPIFTGASSCFDGLACISTSPLTGGFSKDAKWQYIDKSGKIIIGRGSDFVSDFNKGLAYLSYAGILSYFDKTGKVVWSSSK